MSKKCSTCKYRASGYSRHGCNYYYIKGTIRGCSVANCTKYEEGERIGLMKHWTDPKLAENYRRKTEYDLYES